MTVTATKVVYMAQEPELPRGRITYFRNTADSLFLLGEVWSAGPHDGTAWVIPDGVHWPVRQSDLDIVCTVCRRALMTPEDRCCL